MPAQTRNNPNHVEQIYAHTVNIRCRYYRDGEDAQCPGRDTLVSMAFRLPRFPELGHPRNLDHGFGNHLNHEPDAIRGYNGVAQYAGRKFRLRRPHNNLQSLGLSCTPRGRAAKVQHTRDQINMTARRAFRMGIRFRRILSYGGMGLTALFEARNRQGLYNKCVAKVALQGYEEQLKREKNMMRMLAGAPHVVQLQTADDLFGLPGGYASERVNSVLPHEPPDRSDFPEGSAGLFDNLDSCFFMEYVRGGPLSHWLAKARAQHEKFSDDALWRLLLCLVRGCIAMRYPPLYQNSEPETFPPQASGRGRGRVPWGGRKFANMVHFDLDPSNVLVGPFEDPEQSSESGSSSGRGAGSSSDSSGRSGSGTESASAGADGSSDAADDSSGNSNASNSSPSDPDGSSSSSSSSVPYIGDDHSVCPRFLLTDFGLATLVNDEFRRNNFSTLWRHRTDGKVGYMAPEQWTAEWELVQGNPLRRRNIKTAGRYGACTNIWQAGMIVQVCITRRHAEYPPYAGMVPVRQPGGGDPPPRTEAAAIANAVRQGMVPLYPSGLQPEPEPILSHGWALEQPAYRHVDPELRRLLVRCLAYEPAKRPSLEELVEACLAKLEGGSSEEKGRGNGDSDGGGPGKGGGGGGNGSGSGSSSSSDSGSSSSSSSDSDWDDSRPVSPSWARSFFSEENNFPDEPMPDVAYNERNDAEPDTNSRSRGGNPSNTGITPPAAPDSDFTFLYNRVLARPRRPTIRMRPNP